MTEAMTPAEAASKYDMFAVDFEWRPWVTMELALRVDEHWRQLAALQAIREWRDAPMGLLLEAHNFEDWSLQGDEIGKAIDDAQGAWCSWPPEVRA